MKNYIAGLILLLTLPTFGKSSVWIAQKGDSITYIGGTCHLLRLSDLPLPTEFSTAYQQAQTLVFETNIAQLNTPATRQKLIEKMMYPAGSTLDQNLSKESYKLLSEYCTANGIPLAQLNGLKPSMIILTITVIEFNKLGITSRGVDTLFFRQATGDKKQIRALESIDQQIDFITQLGSENPDAFIVQMIKELVQTKSEFTKVLDAWKTGNVNALYELLVVLKAEDPKIYKELLVDRNNAWLPKIDAYSHTPETEFVLVGAAHLVGPDGLLELLRRMGYKISQL